MQDYVAIFYNHDNHLMHYSLLFSATMPPKKKRRVLPSKPGRTRQYLTDNFGTVPDSDVRIGHVLFLYIKNDHSFVGTIQAIQHYVASSNFTPRQLKSLVDRTINKYKNLSREADMKQFDQICREPFEVSSCEPRSPDSSEPQPSTSGESSTPAEPEPKTVPSQDTDSKNLSLRSEAWTPRKKNLKRRLDFVSKSASDMKKRHAENIRDLRAKLHASKVKKLNQVIKRKQTTIDNLRTRIHNNEVAKELTKQKRSFLI